ncbi:hypothetical protein EIL87_19875 [Saccharopolyspora rhizosphaerae]|uniref:Uncharacterized protein n=1 Tax=Saccharopolyspora rhizosphaerae TaxID=2492662 RepID=A0A426JMZ2_9PSEU|nr:hypothetical protein [Saccharopolyspora rhizosphaerae]RRO14445.1 hypothetical protein EIL87_19875 [Saccharopolyspora rhizosphaerae]
MKQGPQIATAVVIGYALGRSRRKRLALVVGGYVLGRRMGDPKDLLGKVSPSGALGKRLVDAAKSAAISAASSKIESLGDDISKRAAQIRTPELGSQDESSQQEQEQESSSEEQESSSEEQGSSEETGSSSEEKGERTRAPRKPSAPRAASTARSAASSSRKKTSSGRSGGNDG